MKVLFITSLYSSLKESIVTDKWEPTGMPAIAKLFDGLKRRGIYFDSVMISQNFNGETIVHKYCNSHFGNTFLLVSTANTKHLLKNALFSRIKLLFKTMSYFNIVRNVLNKNGYNLVYIDRANIVIAWLISLFYDIPVFLRYHGIASVWETFSSLKDKLLQPVRHISFFGDYAYILCSMDGSPAETFLNRYRRKKVKYGIMLNGVDKGELSNEKDKRLLLEKLNISGDVPILLFVGRLVADKGIKPFLETVKRLRSRSKPFHAIIVGDGNLRKWAENFIKDNQLDSQVTLVGQIDHDQIPHYLGIADIYVSLNQLGSLSNTVLEALSAGLAAIVLKSKEQWGQDMSANILRENVLYIDRNNTVTELENAINNLLCRPELITEYKSRAKIVAQEMLPSWDERIEQEIKLMMEAVKS